MAETLSEGPVADFCAQLKQLHASSGLTQKALAQRVNISPAQLSAVLNGKVARPPSWELVEKIVVACHSRGRRAGFTPAETSRILAGWRGRHGGMEEAFRRRQHGRPIFGRATADQVQGADEGGPAEEDAAAAAPGTVASPALDVRFSLPPDSAAFTGREAEMDRITATVLDRARAGGVVAIHAIGGMPGIGKTMLALHAAHLLREEFPGRCLFIDLHAHTPGHEPMQPKTALAGLLAAAGVGARDLPGDLAGRVALWRDKMAGQRALLVLDNAASSAQVAPLLPGGDGCLVLVTSRRHLADLPGVVVPLLLETLAPDEAREMFVRLAPRAGIDPPEAVAELVALAGYLPLAVSLLARLYAHHPSWTLADLVTETKAGLLGLTAEADSVAAAFEVSYRHLDEGQRWFFALLGVHPGATTDPYAAAALTGTSMQQATRMLDGLHREGLLTETGYRRYGMHDLLRRYARDHAAGPDRDQALGRLLDYYQHTATLAQDLLARQTRPGNPSAAAPAPAEVPVLKDAGQALVWARAERDNLLACLDYATRAGQHARVVALTSALAELMRRDGPWADAITRHATAFSSARHLGDQPGQASALANLGIVRWLTDDYQGAARDLEQSLRIYRDLGDRLGQANALNYLGIVRWQTGDFRGAARELEQALAIHRDLGDRLGQANTLTYLGIARRETGDYRGAARVLGQALAIHRDLGDRLGHAGALNELGNMRRLTGDYLGAAGDLEQALVIYRDLGDRLGEAGALTYLGILRREMGDYREAAGDLDQALAVYRDLGDRLGEAGALLYFGTVRRATGDYRAAAGDLEQVLAICRDLGERGGEAEVLNETGTLKRVSGEPTAAQAHHQQALELARAIGSAQEEARALAGLGRCAAATGDTSQAAPLLQEAYVIFERIGAAEAPAVLAELGPLTGPAATE